MGNKEEAEFLRAFGDRIAAGRKKLGLTQAEFAEKAEISTAHLASIETGRRWPHLTIISVIAGVLGTTPYGLVRGIDQEIERRPKKASPLGA